MALDSNFVFLPQGALIQRFEIAGQNIVLSFPTPEPYRNAPFFGETIGRVANRIKGASFSLEGQKCHLVANDGSNHAHGGLEGWGKKHFQGPIPVFRNGKESVTFTYTSPHEEEGYPGTVDVRVWYSAYLEDDHEVSKVVLEAEYEVELVGSECNETIINLTNHSYFNLSGDPTIEGTVCTLKTSSCLSVDQNLIPTGAITESTEVQKDKPLTFTAVSPVIDKCFIMDSNASQIPVDTRIRPLRSLAELSHAKTGIHLEILSTEPAFQVYTGDYVDIPAREGLTGYGPRCGICIEPGRYINAINVPEWRNMVILRRGQLYGARIVYKACRP